MLTVVCVIVTRLIVKGETGFSFVLNETHSVDILSVNGQL